LTQQDENRKRTTNFNTVKYKEAFSIGIVLIYLCFSSGCQQEDPQAKGIANRLPKKVSYNFHIRPILADRCFSCHGPDEAARKADLRLDQAESAYARLVSGDKAIHKGRLKKSAVYHRIYSDDVEKMMPPPESNLSLSDYEKALLSKWIKQGANYEPHWAFQAVELPEVPNPTGSDLAVNELDHFILQRLEQEELTLSSLASKERLIRRLSFDLRGLPPTLEEIDQFVRDSRPEAYEQLVDRFIDSDAYAERMAMDWLDLARYADSQGLHSDGWRSMYPWRDWVIQAFRKRMPYNQFLSWQLAGDLLPDPSRDQLIATGFNRNHKTTAEGGVVDEEYRAEYVHDRVATTATAFLGLTMECARCHDHKYDPISQKEYYQFYAFFNQVDELGMSGDDGNAGPNLLLPSPATEERLQTLKAQIKEKRELLAQTQEALAAQKTFIQELQKESSSWKRKAAIDLPFDRIVKQLVDGRAAATASGDARIVTDDIRGKVLELNGEYEFVTVKDQGLFDQHQAFSAGIWVKPEEYRTTQTLVGNSGQKGTFWRGWDLILDSLNRPTLRLIHALPHDVLAVSTKEGIPIQQWSHVAFSYDGSGRASGVKLFVDGVAVDHEIAYDRLQRSIYPIAFNKSKTKRGLRLGKSYRAFTGEYGIYSGRLDSFYLFARVLSEVEIGALVGQKSLDEQLNLARKADNPAITKKLAETWLFRHPHPLQNELSTLRQAHFSALDTVGEVMIMQELKQARTTYILNRGNYDEPMEEVAPRTPASMLTFDPSFPANRLGLAKWMLHPDNPLTSRVIVNRLWQQFFGNGLVGTPHDLGLQGSLPTHPELLDWLAATLMKEYWDIQYIQKKIVLSATYRQSSKVSPVLLEKDPENLLFARAPTYRLPAEMIRDNALASSGLLHTKVGGPSVKPVQPAGLWQEKTSSTHILRKYEPDEGQAQHRRSLYTFVRRTSPHPAMTAFDAPNRSVCTAKRQYTNTPMQALVLLNDPQFVEASRVLAQAALDFDEDLIRQISWVFRKLTGLEINKNQLETLLELFSEEESRFKDSPLAAQAYSTIGSFPQKKEQDPLELASMTLVVNTIMNFDDFYMKR